MTSFTKNTPQTDGVAARDDDWVGPSDLPREGYGITRTHCYVLAERGEIEMISLRPPGARKGKALVRLGSVRAYIERCRAQREMAVAQ